MLRSQIEQDYLNKFIVQGTIWQHIRLYTHKHTDIHTHTLARITVRRVKNQDGSYKVQDNWQY